MYKNILFNKTKPLQPHLLSDKAAMQWLCNKELEN